VRSMLERPQRRAREHGGDTGELAALRAGGAGTGADAGAGEGEGEGEGVDTGSGRATSDG
jgi:hypothetical protein